MGEAFFHMNLQGLPMLIFTNLVVAIGTYEFYKMVKISGKEVYDKFGILVSIIIPNLIYLANRSKYLDQSMVGLVIIIATKAPSTDFFWTYFCKTIFKELSSYCNSYYSCCCI